MSAAERIQARTTNANQENSSAKVQRPNSSQAAPSPAEHVLFLQSTIGNQAVQRLFKAGILQPKLRIGRPGDIYEQEADRIAEQVMRMAEPQVHRQRQQQEESKEEEELIQTKPVAEQITPLVQRRNEEEEEEEGLQAKASPGLTPSVSPDIESHIRAMKGGGQPLPASTRAFFEPRFGYGFSSVRVHTDTKAAEAARLANARAFTTGRDLIFGRGQYAPETASGKRLLAHELTHVLQQGHSSKNTNVLNTVSQSYGKQPIHGILSSWNLIQLKNNKKKWIDSSIIIREGVLPLIRGIFHAKDGTHIRKSGNKLQIDSDYATPRDPFRWSVLKEVIESKEKVEIKISNLVKLTFHLSRNGKLTSTDVDDVIRGAGFTAVSKNLQKKVYGKLDGITSQHNDKSMIYISTLGDSNTMAHELLGHFYLATKGVPFGHEDVLTKKHNIKDPRGNVFTGKVIDFLKQFVETRVKKPATLRAIP